MEISILVVDISMEIFVAHEKRRELDQSTAARRSARDAGTEMCPRIKSAQRL